jgi:hypothetical protein
MTKICLNALLVEAMPTGKTEHQVSGYIAPDDRSADVSILLAGFV